MKDVIEAMAVEASKLHGMIGPGCDWDYEQLIRAALSAALERGWKLSPIEPTDEMISAGEEASRFAIGAIAEIHRAMIAASPEVK